MLKRLVVLCLILFCYSAGFCGLTVVPSRMEVSIPPGGTFDGLYTVRNDFNTTAAIKVETKDWYVLPDNQGITVSKWLAVSPHEFTLKSGESKDIKYKVKVPSDAISISNPDRSC